MLFPLLVLLAADPLTPEAERHFVGMPVTAFSTYLVEGAKASEVAESLNLGRPTTPSGERVYALTTWRMPTSWNSDAFGVCSPQSVRIAVEFSVTLPVLSRDAALALKEGELVKWRDYMDFLASHEAARMQRVLDGARQLQDRMHEAESCDSLNSTLNEGVRAIGARARALDVEIAQQFKDNPSTRRGFP